MTADLIAKLERAESGSRELDAEIVSHPISGYTGVVKGSSVESVLAAWIFRKSLDG